jgi:transposase
VTGAKPKFHFRFEKNKFNTESFIAFLETIVRYYSARNQRVHMIVDNVGYHRAALEWVGKRSELIELHFLPAYSPKLNAAEQLWRRAKREATHNRFFPTLVALRKALFRRFNRFQGNPASLRGIVKRWL